MCLYGDWIIRVCVCCALCAPPPFPPPTVSLGDCLAGSPLPCSAVTEKAMMMPHVRECWDVFENVSVGSLLEKESLCLRE